MDTLKRMQMIFDEQTAKILKLTSEYSMTASQLCEELGIPHSVCYRKIKQLKDAELLDEHEPEDPWEAGNKPKSYISNLDKAYIALERGEMMIVMKLRNSQNAKVFRLSNSL